MKLEFGTVSAWDAKTNRIRVTIHETKLQTFWLQVPQGRTKNTRRRSPVELGTQVAIILRDDGVDGILLGALYSSVDAPPITDDDTDYIEYKDGTVIEYSPSSHELNVSLTQGGKLNIIAPGGTHIDTEMGIEINAPKGATINAAAGMVINAAAGVTIKAEKGTKAYGTLELMQGDVIVEGISFKDHTHPNVAKGDSSTGKPQ